MYISHILFNRHDITEILLKVALNTIILILAHSFVSSFSLHLTLADYST